MFPDIISITVDTDKTKDVAKGCERYDYLSIPLQTQITLWLELPLMTL